MKIQDLIILLQNRIKEDEKKIEAARAAGKSGLISMFEKEMEESKKTLAYVKRGLRLDDLNFDDFTFFMSGDCLKKAILGEIQSEG